MALDYEHHLEGTLSAPGIFRVYLYDARVQLLHPDRVREAKGTVYWGDLPEPPGIPLVTSKDGHTLEATLDRTLNFPVTLTVLLQFPANNSPEAKPELFTFTFNRFSPASSSPSPPSDAADPSRHKMNH